MLTVIFLSNVDGVVAFRRLHLVTSIPGIHSITLPHVRPPNHDLEDEVCCGFTDWDFGLGRNDRASLKLFERCLTDGKALSFENLAALGGAPRNVPAFNRSFFMFLLKVYSTIAKFVDFEIVESAITHP